MTNHSSDTFWRDFRARLADLVGATNVLEDAGERWAYGFDNSRRHALPDAVVFASSHEEVAGVAQLCNAHGVPLVARGRGTGTTGATVPVGGGVVLSLERMDRILRVDPANRIMVVEPGVTNQAVQEAAAEHGFFWPPDPTSAGFCTVGGNLAYNSAGPRAVKYGTPRENTTGLRAVTGEGKEIRTGVYTSKGVVGYDLTRLVIGSEGTLALVTQATLRLTPLAESKRTIQAVYRNVHSAAAAVSRIMAGPVTPCALEFIDGNAIAMIRDYSDADLPDAAGALLMIEVDGPADCMESAADTVSRQADIEGLVSLKTARTENEVQRLWQTRKALSPALRTVAPKKINEDVVVPVSRMAELVDGLDGLAAEFGIQIVNFGHAGNGNIHVNLLIDPSIPDELNKARVCLDRVFALVLTLDGTLSGEHGIGIEKREFIGREIDATTLDLMRKLKKQFDPNGILNPGKIFPAR